MNKRVTEKLEYLCTQHFAKVCKITIGAQQVTSRHGRNSNKSQLKRQDIGLWYVENHVEIVLFALNLENGLSLHLVP
jgi:hypothetical protein